MADRVFEDRVGLLVISPANLPDRLPKIKAFAGGLIRDVFLPRSATLRDVSRVGEAGLYAQLWAAVDGLAATAYALRWLSDFNRLGVRGAELNIELGSDPPLAGYIEAVIARIRQERPNARLRVNLAAWKGFAVPRDRLVVDPNLYVCEQNYLGNMDELLSPADVAGDLFLARVPYPKLTVCYAAACRVLGSTGRVRTLPELSRVRRGVIFSDDLMVEAGLL